MTQTLTLIIATIFLVVGSVAGYFARQSIAKREAGTIESKLQKRILDAKTEADSVLFQAKEKSFKLVEETKRESDSRREELLKMERILMRRESVFDKRLVEHEAKEIDFRQKVERLKALKENIETLKVDAEKNLERIANLSIDDAKKELLMVIEKDYQKDILEKIKKLELGGYEAFEKKARELVSLAVQKCAVSQAQEITSTTLSLPSEEIKGRIIGKEGRNIRVFEKLTGVEIIVDETPETVVISGFDPVRRQVAKTALEKLIKDGRIQPARIEETVAQAEAEIVAQIKEAGEQAIYDTNVVGLDPRIVQLLGRLRFRTSYGQNVLLHSIEVAHLAGILAHEVGANPAIAKKAGLLHDIGKSVDHQIEGSHVDIGIKILEKFGVEKEIVNAMKSHHGDYPYESIEGILVQVGDAISGARPGARRDNLENYIKRLTELEAIANAFPGVEKSYAISAGREIRVFVKPEEIDDLTAKKMAREIANQVQDELKYPGEIKVTLIRENRVVEYAR
ncbi:MAG: ribonuclease Y [bacterium]